MKANQGKRDKMLRQLPLYLMLIPSVILVGIYSYGPMAGISIAFQKFVPAKGLFGNQKWVGLYNFETLFTMPNIWSVIRNTVIIASGKIIGGIIVPVIFALLLNEVRNVFVKRSFQTWFIYLIFFHGLFWLVY